MENKSTKYKFLFKEILLFLGSKIFIKNLLILSGILLVILFLLFQWLNIYTDHGNSYPSPNLVGFTINDLKTKKIAGLEKFSIVVNDSSGYSWKNKNNCEMHPPGYIMSQNPEPARLIKKGRTIHVSITPQNQTKVSFEPKIEIFERNHYSKAKIFLENLQLCVDIVEVFSPKDEGKVLKISHKGKLLRSEGDGKKGKLSFKRGDKIVLTVASSSYGGGTSASPVDVPNLIAKKYNYELAKTFLEASGLGIQIVDAMGVVDTNKAMIVQQFPMPKDTILYLPEGSKVKVWLK